MLIIRFEIFDQYKIASKIILFVISRLIFFDEKAICYSIFSLISGILAQQLNKSHIISFTLVAAIG